MEYISNENMVIFCIGGKARSGKSLVCDYLKKLYLDKGLKVVVSPYTKYLKKYIEEITGTKIKDNNKPRALLQNISSDIIKGKLGYKDFFINRQLEDLSIYKYFFDVVIIPDVRFPREIEEIKKHFSNVISIGVIRDNFDNGLSTDEKNDITEVALDNYEGYDYVINNNNDDNDLHSKVVKIFNDIFKE